MACFQRLLMRGTYLGPKWAKNQSEALPKWEKYSHFTPKCDFKCPYLVQIEHTSLVMCSLELCQVPLAFLVPKVYAGMIIGMNFVPRGGAEMATEPQKHPESVNNRIFFEPFGLDLAFYWPCDANHVKSILQNTIFTFKGVPRMVCAG